MLPIDGKQVFPLAGAGSAAPGATGSGSADTGRTFGEVYGDEAPGATSAAAPGEDTASGKNLQSDGESLPPAERAAADTPSGLAEESAGDPATAYSEVGGVDSAVSTVVREEALMTRATAVLLPDSAPQTVPSSPVATKLTPDAVDPALDVAASPVDAPAAVIARELPVISPAGADVDALVPVALATAPVAEVLPRRAQQAALPVDSLLPTAGKDGLRATAADNASGLSTPPPRASAVPVPQVSTATLPQDVIMQPPSDKAPVADITLPDGLLSRTPETTAHSAGTAPGVGQSLFALTEGGSELQMAQRMESASSLLPRPGDRVWDGEFAGRLIMMVKNGVQQASLQLNPAELDRLEIQIATEGDQTRVNFLVQNAAARDAIEQAMPRLRDMLEQSGLQLAHSDVADQSQSNGRERAFAGSPSAETSAPDSASLPGDNATGASSLQPRGMIDHYV